MATSGPFVMSLRADAAPLSRGIPAGPATFSDTGPYHQHGGTFMTSDTTEIQDVQQKAQDTASTVVQQVQQLAETNVSSQKQRVSETLDAVAKTLRDSGEGVREQQPQVASVVDQAAQRVEKFSTFIRDRDVNELVTEAENFARREPLIFLGGALAVGFIAARFVKASSPQSGNGQSRNGGSFRARSGDGNG